MDVTFINAFERATVETVKRMGLSEVKPGRAFLKQNNIPAGDISGIAGITGHANGLFSVSFSEACICRIVGDLRGEQCTLADEAVPERVHEITGAIMESAASSLESKGLKIGATPPTVVFGKDHTLGSMTDTPMITIPFSMAAGTLFIHVSIKENSDKHSQSAVGQAKKEQIRDNNAEMPEGGASEDDQGNASVMDKTRLLKNRLKELHSVRDDIQKQLQDKPFLARSQRMQLKKAIPLYDAKIKQLKSDLMALEMMAKVSEESLENPVIQKHYQHYENKKRP